MSFTVTNGYSPRSYEAILADCVAVVNSEFKTQYTIQSFVGTNLWKFLYAEIQGMMTIENNIAELGVKLQDYIRTQNEELIIHRSSADGIMQALKDELGLVSSLKPTESSADAGEIYLAVDIDPEGADYASKKQEIFNALHKYLTAGLHYNGTETGTVTATNGQVFNYAYELPTEKALKIKIQVKVSDNNNLFVETTNSIKEKFLENFAELYRFGYDFEPQQFLNISRDLPFASEITTQYSTNGGSSWGSAVLQSDYKTKYTISNADVEIEVVQGA